MFRVPPFFWPWLTATLARPAVDGAGPLEVPELLLFPPPQAASVIAAATSATAIGSGFRVRTKMAPSSVELRQRSERGFRASCNPSPTRLKARTVSTSASPGNSMYHQAESKIGVASAIIWPQLAVGGWTPTPRNESAASKSTLVGR